MRRFGMITAVAFGLGSTTPLLASEPATYNGYEMPQYSVQQKDGVIELRQYEPHIVAEVTVTGTRREAANAGFRLLAGYIFGDNTTADKVAMTSPVTQVASEKIEMTSPVTQTGGDGTWTVRFMMPSEYTLDTLPTPEGDAIRFVEVDPGQRLVLRFSGRAMAKSMAPYVQQLRDYADANDIAIEGAVEAAYYDDPFTLPWKRRNEVSFAVR